MNSKYGLLIWASIFVSSLGCLESPTLKQCVPECERGTLCNEADGLCVPTNQKTTKGEISGRAFDLVRGGDSIFFSAQNSEGDILVSEFSNSLFTNQVILAEFENQTIRKTAVDVNDTTLVVTWREGENYVSAFRELNASKVSWQYQILEGNYRASDDFDLVHVGDSFSLIFRDLSGGLFRLTSNDLTKKNWAIDLIDDGTQSTAMNCESSPGFDLSALNREAQILVAYHDRSCGALKVARNEKGVWTINTVDTGNFSNKIIDVGRQPSLSVNPAGAVNISHRSAENKLLFSFESEGTFAREVIDDGKNTDVLSREVINQVGAFSSLLVNDQGIKVVYFDGTDQRLLLATKVGEDWTLKSLMEGAFIAGMNSKIVNFDNSDWVFSEKLELGEDGLNSSLIAIELAP